MSRDLRSKHSRRHLARSCRQSISTAPLCGNFHPAAASPIFSRPFCLSSTFTRSLTHRAANAEAYALLSMSTNFSLTQNLFCNSHVPPSSRLPLRNRCLSPSPSSLSPHRPSIYILSDLLRVAPQPVLFKVINRCDLAPPPLPWSVPSSPE